MTVAATVRKVGPTPGNSLATVFPFAFKVFTATDIRVQQTVIATGAISTLVLNDPLGYTVALNPDQNSNPGGSITYNPLGVPMPATLALTIDSVVPQVQGTHIINGGSFFANNIEDAVDKVCINVQDQAAKLLGAIQFPSADSAALNAILPAAAQRANLVCAFDSLGNVIAAAGGSNIPIAAAWAPVVQATTLPLGRAAMGFAAFFDTLIVAASAAAFRGLIGAGTATSPLTTKGDLWTFGGADTRLPVGTDGKTLVADSTQATGLSWALTAVGQCQLTKSGANLLLSPFGGNKITINSTLQTVPDAGVTLAPPAVASTAYYIYAFMSAGVMTLENVATAPAVQAGTGVKIKTGDATRTLVGQARTTAGNAWADTPAQRFVISYFNRRNKGLQSATGIAASTASGANVEVDSTKRAEFLTWSDEDSVLGAYGTFSHGTNAQSVFASLGIDSTVTVGQEVFCTITVNLNPEAFTVQPEGVSLADGYHYATLLFRSSGGAGTANINQAQVTGMIRG